MTRRRLIGPPTSGRSFLAALCTVVAAVSSCGHDAAGETDGGTPDTGGGGSPEAGSSDGGRLGVWPSSPTLFCTDGRQPVSPCPTPGQPAFGQDGNFPKRNPAYTVAAGAVADSLTGLEWQQAASGAMTWVEGTDACRMVRLGGHDDWRLPNRLELLSLVDYGRFDPAGDDGAFPDAVGMFWSSSQESTNVWVVEFADGKPFPSAKDSLQRARCVRGAPRDAEFERSSDAATTLDRSTGLRWTHTTTPIRQSWLVVLAACRGSLSGRTDWRVPTIKELATLLSAGADGPAWLAIPGALWSATPSARYSTAQEDGWPAAWRFDGRFPELGVAMMSGESSVTCVRSE